MKILVDADACPVKKEIDDLCRKYAIEVVYVASYAHYSRDNSSEWVYVDANKEEADLYIVNHVTKGDIVVTQDMGLASLLTHKGVYVITNRGKKLEEEKMSQILHDRYLSYKQLHAGERIKGPRSLTDEDRLRFSRTLEEQILESRESPGR